MQNVEEDLFWLVGAVCRSIEIASPTFTTFTFSQDARLVVECPWRFVRDGHIMTSSFDHKQLFGLPERVDAPAEMLRAIGTQPVVAVSCIKGLLDLSLDFGGAGTLQVVPFSSGYEGWQLHGPGGLQFVAVGGGELAVFPARS